MGTVQKGVGVKPTIHRASPLTGIAYCGARGVAGAKMSPRRSQCKACEDACGRQIEANNKTKDDRLKAARERSRASYFSRKEWLRATSG
jgi:hypothetical protein